MIRLSDALMLRYFWEEKGDLTCYTGWPELRRTLEDEHPAVVDAWSAYKNAEAKVGSTITELIELCADEDDLDSGES